jgi:hypothetical protein
MWWNFPSLRRANNTVSIDLLFTRGLFYSTISRPPSHIVTEKQNSNADFLGTLVHDDFFLVDMTTLVFFKRRRMENSRCNCVVHHMQESVAQYPVSLILLFFEGGQRSARDVTSSGTRIDHDHFLMRL